jgi:hypothetical protein
VLEVALVLRVKLGQLEVQLLGPSVRAEIEGRDEAEGEGKERRKERKERRGGKGLYLLGLSQRSGRIFVQLPGDVQQLFVNFAHVPHVRVP